jgi:uncharacterized protein
MTSSIPRGDDSYAYVWEFRVASGCEDEFERIYGAQGEWAQLFGKGTGYLGTELHQDFEAKGRYITIDHWTSKAACEAFRLKFKAEFDELDEHCESLTEDERLIGEFTCLARLKKMPNLSYISAKAAPRESSIHGTGLFAVASITKGEVVCVKGGYIFNRQTLESMPDWYGAAEIQMADDLFIGPLIEEERTGSMIFSNHSCEPNLGVQGQVVFVAMRDIAAGEELTHDWATTDDDDYEMECRCGAARCRKVITGQDWRRRDLQEKYKGYFSWYLAEKVKSMS